jgi:hypothetical protein
MMSSLGLGKLGAPRWQFPLGKATWHVLQYSQPRKSAVMAEICGLVLASEKPQDWQYREMQERFLRSQENQEWQTK